VTTGPAWSAATRLGGLRRFAAAITFLTVLGHFYLGFEPSFAQPLVSIAAAYGAELLLEWVDARATGRELAFTRGRLVTFLLPAHITGLAIALLLYPGARLLPVVFASVAAIASKAILRRRINGRSRHLFNPSNLGLTLTLILFPSVGIAPPYQFTESLGALGDWLLPAFIIVSGTYLNARFTSRLPLIAAWLGTFVLQALVRDWFLGASVLGALMPMTGMAFLLFTFYMITDPPTTPSSLRGQLLFGSAVALTYGVLMEAHIVFGLFFGLTIVCGIRSAALLLSGLLPGSAAKQGEALSATSARGPTA
jgi:Na+-translocating ferredoxin:NAD+ oxidoreductase RnfD subunit